MQKQIIEPINRQTLGKGVFKPSRAHIAGEMKCRIRLGEAADGDGGGECPPDPTGSRH